MRPPGRWLPRFMLLRAASRRGARTRRRAAGVAAGRGRDRKHDRRGLLDQPAPRGRLCAAHLARVPVAGGSGSSADARPPAAALGRRPDARRAGGRTRRAFISASRRRTAASSRCGARRAAFPRCAWCWKSPRRACWSSSIIAATNRASTSTSRCSKGIRSSWSTSARRCCPTARRSCRRCWDSSPTSTLSVGRFGECAGAARRLDARDRPRRRAARRAAEYRVVARVDCLARALCRVAGVLGTADAESDAAPATNASATSGRRRSRAR